jgi:predicted Zn-dependent peptidase
VDIEVIKREQLSDFHQDFFKDFEIICSGKITRPLLQELIDTLGVVPILKGANRTVVSRAATLTPTYLEKENTVQASIRLGKRIISRTHVDYPVLLLLNHVLGGYFGSRLMKNIREEKGLTYGIYSSITALQHDSYLSIGADVNPENRALTIQEIKNELKNLRTQHISPEELETSKSHFIGSLQAEITTPFAHADKIKNILLYSLPDNFYQELLNKIDSATTNDLLETAQRYFDDESFSVVAVG